MNIVEYNATSLPGCTKVFIPEERVLDGWNHPSITVSTHGYDFVEYRNSADEILLRHTVGLEW